MKYRHEFKFQLSPNDYLTVRARLRAVLLHDSHVGENNEYHIRSIYFDTPGDKALREKIDGVNSREKFRIRFYNGDLTHINLEKKSKLNGLSHKQTTAVSGAIYIYCRECPGDFRPRYPHRNGQWRTGPNVFGCHHSSRNTRAAIGSKIR